MRLEQIKDPAKIVAIRQAYFSFDKPSNIEVMMHAMRVDGQVIGYIATEDFNTVGGPHLGIIEGFKNKHCLNKVKWIFLNVYFPLMKELGKEFMVTTCAADDPGTIRMMKDLGFTVETHVIAERKL